MFPPCLKLERQWRVKLKKNSKLRQTQAQEKQNLSVSSQNPKQRIFNLSKLTMNLNYREIDSSSSIFLISSYKLSNLPFPPTRRCGERERHGGVGVVGEEEEDKEIGNSSERTNLAIHQCYTLSEIADLHMEILLLHDS